MDDPTFTSTFRHAQLPTHEEISRRAQELWEQRGRPSGRDEEIWFEAERQLRSSATAPASIQTSPTTATRPDDGNVAPASKPTVVPPVTTLPPSTKTARPGGKKRPGGGAK